MVLEVERRDSVAVVIISAEAARNAFDSDSMSEISSTLNDLMDESSVRGIVLTGTGRFSVQAPILKNFSEVSKMGVSVHWSMI